MAERASLPGTSENRTGVAEDLPLAQEVYSSRHNRLAALQATAARRETLLGHVKLALGALVFLLGVFAFSHIGVVPYLGAAIVLFVALAVVHERLLQAIAHRARLLGFYGKGLARLDGSWRTVAAAGRKPARGTAPIVDETGEAFRQADHPYASDLDLFGPGSIFHLLSTARTYSGESTLAHWLLTPASPEVVRLRQAAVQELAPGLDLREALATTGEDIRATVHAATLADWADSASGWRGATAIRVLALLLGAVWVATIVYWATTGNAIPVIASSVASLVVRGLLAGRTAESLAGLDRAARELAVLSSLLGLVERQTFDAPLLVELQNALRTDGVAPSKAIARLSRITQMLDAGRNMVFKPLDYGLLWTLQFALAADRWRALFGPCVRQWLAAVGELEALEALASHSFEHRGDVFPDVVSPEDDLAAPPKTLLEVRGFAHPLLDPATAISNDLTLASGTSDALQLVIISGPNMAGKSTFLRGLGVNVVLAQAGAPVRARAMRLTPLSVAASISVSDSLASGISRFYAEIRRVKLVSDLADGPLPVLFLLDELLSGTNSHDRFTGTQFVVRSLLERGAIGIVTTHDLALTVIPDSLVPPLRGINSHFEDRIEHNAKDGDRLSFDYRLSPGIVKTSNALALMRSIGLKVDG